MIVDVINTRMEEQYPLNRKWKIWEMWNQNKSNSFNFTDNMQEIGEFDSIYTFWQHWNYFPHADPAALFENPTSKVKVIVEGLNQSIEAIGVFQDKIVPAWEDETNKKGCDLCIRKYPADFRKLKEYWDKLVISMIGESFPYSEEITGCRVVDKKHNYKFELWLKYDLSHDSSEKTTGIKNAFLEILNAAQCTITVSPHNHN